MSFFKNYQGLIVMCSLCAVASFTPIYLVMSAGRLAVEQGAGALSTLPMGVQYTAIMLGAIPVSKILMQYGVRQGLFITQSLGLTGGIICLLSAIYLSFPLLLMGVVFTGVSMAGFHQMRFIATDTVAAEQKPVALSLVVAMPVVGALGAAPLSSWVMESFGSGDVLENYIWLYATFVGILSISLLILLSFQIPTKTGEIADKRIDLSLLKKQGVKPAIFIAALAYGGMTFLMTATPLLMQEQGLALQHSNEAIGYHVLGMSVPSLFMGFIISKLGVRLVLGIGVLNYVGVFYSNLFLGHSYSAMVLALVLLGVGWSALYVTASTALTQLLKPEERLKIQGFNDACVFSCSGFAGFGAGVALYSVGWFGTNVILLAIAALIALATFQIKIPKPKPH